MVATCLVKDPKKRPTSEKLLKHPFFKQARAVNYLARTILDGLAPLGDRFRTLKVLAYHKLFLEAILQKMFSPLMASLNDSSCQEKEAAILGQHKALYEDKEQLSQVRIWLWTLSKVTCWICFFSKLMSKIWPLLFFSCFFLLV